MAKYIIVTIVLVAVSYSIGRFTTPAKINTVIQEKVVFQDRIVENKTDTIKKHVVEVKKPDGTDTITTDIGEKENDNTNTVQSTVSTSTQTTSVTNRPAWRLGAAYQPTVPGYQSSGYGVILERQVVSEVYAGVLFGNDHSAKLILTIGF